MRRLKAVESYNSGINTVKVVNDTESDQHTKKQVTTKTILHWYVQFGVLGTEEDLTNARQQLKAVVDQIRSTGIQIDLQTSLGVRYAHSTEESSGDSQGDPASDSPTRRRGGSAKGRRSKKAG